MSIEGIALETFIAVPQAYNHSTTLSHQCHTVFHSENIKQDATTTTANTKRLISLLKEKK